MYCLFNELGIMNIAGRNKGLTGCALKEHIAQAKGDHLDEVH